MNLFSLMRQFTIRFRMLGAIAVVLVLLGLLGGAGMFGMFRIYSMSEDFMNSSFRRWVTWPSCTARWALSASMRRT